LSALPAGAAGAGMGSGLVLLNNLGQLVVALGGGQGPAVYVSLFSIMNCAGRIAFGCAAALAPSNGGPGLTCR